MLFKLTHPLPEKVLVAVSGGVDSMAALHWLRRGAKNRVCGIVHVNHGPPGDDLFADRAEALVLGVGQQLEIPVYVSKLKKCPGTGSKEAWWRDQRYSFFRSVSQDNGDLPIVLGHNFNDCLEEYLMCTLVRERFGTIPYAHAPCIRPFRLWKRESIQQYADRQPIAYLEDPSNKDLAYKRNYIRHVLVPSVLKLNPGIWNLVERALYEQDYPLHMYTVGPSDTGSDALLESLKEQDPQASVTTWTPVPMPPEPPLRIIREGKDKPE